MHANVVRSHSRTPQGRVTATPAARPPHRVGPRQQRMVVMLLAVRHVYVHVPFCARRCSYCDFSLAVRKRIPAREYVAAVLQELRLVGMTDPGREPGEALETIYFGGGTPSLLPPDALATLLTSLRDAFPVTSFRDAVEVTVEANPEDVTPDAATSWRRAGINRVSLGAQSFDDRVLQWMHRSHDAARITATVWTRRAASRAEEHTYVILSLQDVLYRDIVETKRAERPQRGGNASLNEIGRTHV